jgi:hypothetical protein
MILTDCKTCSAPVMRSNYKGLPTYLDLTALDRPAIARAWLADQRTFIVHTHHNRQSATWLSASPVAIAELLAEHKAGTPMDYTVLVAHDCPSPLVFIDQALDTWQAKDAARHRPAPQHPVVSEGIPF